MKKITLICFALFGALLSFQSCDKDEDIFFPEYPQDKLQFSKVVFLEMEGVYTLSGAAMVLDSMYYEVPVGQVLKVESASARDMSRTDAGNGYIYLNDKVIFNSDPTDNSGNPYLPLWLPQGSYKIDLGGNANTGDTLKGYVSGILYDVVQ